MLKESFFTFRGEGIISYNSKKIIGAMIIVGINLVNIMCSTYRLIFGTI